eukprot:9480304-Ditylum_brightwellii.AAC.2
MLVYINVASAVRSVCPGGSVRLVTFSLRVVESQKAAWTGYNWAGLPGVLVYFGEEVEDREW